MIGLDFIKCVVDLARDDEDRKDVVAIICPHKKNSPEWNDLIERCKDECTKLGIKDGVNNLRTKGKEVMRWLDHEGKILFPKDTLGEIPVIEGGRHWAKSESEIKWRKPHNTPK